MARPGGINMNDEEFLAWLQANAANTTQTEAATHFKVQPASVNQRYTKLKAFYTKLRAEMEKRVGESVNDPNSDNYIAPFPLFKDARVSGTEKTVARSSAMLNLLMKKGAAKVEASTLAEVAKAIDAKPAPTSGQSVPATPAS